MLHSGHRKDNMADTKKLYGFDGLKIVEVKNREEALDDKTIDKLKSKGYSKEGYKPKKAK